MKFSQVQSARFDRAGIRKLLSDLIINPHHNWQLQGMGMFRLYLAKEWRLHVWDNTFKTPNVTMLHNHPWDFESHIVCGRITNVVYQKKENLLPTHDERTIVCGPGGGECEKPATPVSLRLIRSDDYYAGEVYGEKASDIHETIYENGTITLVKRTFKEDTEHALVYPLHGKPWVSAEPRKAEPWEVAQALSTALCVMLADGIGWNDMKDFL